MIDRRLASDFWLHEFPGWETATAAQLAALEETVAHVLQPVRDAFGPVVPTSWVRWRSGAPRTGHHADGGAVDFVTLEADADDAFAWGGRYLVPQGYVGRWILEPPEAGQSGPHIHVAPRRVTGDVQVLRETAPGVYAWALDVLPEGWESPLPIPGIVATAGGGRWAWLAILALILAALRRRP